ncbi:MAG: hypothetical protein NTZ56_03355 [Acidobacteria bacterium]|nr:hypothetical protein [Acidobacteriota bacterium]
MALTRAVAAAALVFLAGCSTPPPPKKEAPPAKPVTGLSGVFKAYQMARASWAQDAMPLKAHSINLETVKSGDGKAGVWSVTFYSESRQKSRTYTWSAIEGEGFHKDVFAQQEEGFTPSRQARPFRIEALKSDTDKAWEVAVKKVEDVIKKSPNLPAFFVLETSDRFPDPYWRVVWGESISSSNFSVFVNTTNGEFLMKGN